MSMFFNKDKSKNDASAGEPVIEPIHDASDATDITETIGNPAEMPTAVTEEMTKDAIDNGAPPPPPAPGAPIPTVGPPPSGSPAPFPPPDRTPPAPVAPSPIANPAAGVLPLSLIHISEPTRPY